MKTICLWVREDGLRPKALEKGKTPPGPGKVAAVSNVRTADHARSVLSAYLHAVDLGANLETLLDTDEVSYARLKKAMRQVEWING